MSTSQSSIFKIMGASSSSRPFPINGQKRIALVNAINRKIEKHRKLGRSIKNFVKYHGKHASRDQWKLFTEIISTWTTIELSRLVEFYESGLALQRICVESSDARPVSSNVCDRLSTLINNPNNCDIRLCYRGKEFRVHSLLLRCRSSYFRNLLEEFQMELNCKVEVPVVDEKVCSSVFLSILRYIYSDEYPSVQVCSVRQFDALLNRYGIQKTLVQCLRSLHETRCDYDVLLNFASSMPSPGPCTSRISKPVLPTKSHPCHSFVLASHSRFLASLIQRLRYKPSVKPSLFKATIELTLEDAVVSARYAPFILKLMYQGLFDLSLVNECNSNPASSSLSEAEAIISGHIPSSPIEEVMNLHHIGRFLEFPSLISKCEEYIVETLEVDDNLHVILKWCESGAGSSWVHRRALDFIQDNFTQIAKSTVLYTLSEHTLVLVLQSDFLQATELDLLQAVIKWSQHRITTHMIPEPSKPSLVYHASPNPKKMVNLKELEDEKLREITAELVTHIRIPHLLYADDDPTMCDAKKRRLLTSHASTRTTTDPYLLKGEASSRCSAAWVPPCQPNNHDYQAPRCYAPFYEAARALLDERTHDVSQSNVVHLRRPRAHNAALAHPGGVSHQPLDNMDPYKEEFNRLLLGSAAMEAMSSRTEELLQTHIIIEALQTCWDKNAVLKQVSLRAARELGLPDQIIYALKSCNLLKQITVDSCDQPDFLQHCLVPDLAPESVLMARGLSSLLDKFPDQSSPRVTRLAHQASNFVADDESYRAGFPDITLHSSSSSDPTYNTGKNKPKRLGSRRCMASGSHTVPRGDPRNEPSPPDVIHMSSAPHPQPYRLAATLDSSRRCSRNTSTMNPYRTPRESPRRAPLLTNSLIERRLQSLGSAGPPPDIMVPAAPRRRRVAGFDTPPDITSSPSNTWHAML